MAEQLKSIYEYRIKPGSEVKKGPSEHLALLAYTLRRRALEPDFQKGEGMNNTNKYCSYRSSVETFEFLLKLNIVLLKMLLLLSHLILIKPG